MPPPRNGSTMVMTDAGMPQDAAGPACELSVVMIDAGEREPKRGECERWDEPVGIEPFHGRRAFMHPEDLDLPPAAMDGIENEIAIDERYRVIAERLDLPGSKPLSIRPRLR